MLSTAMAQQKLPYNILWRISGKGLNKPSYLFGTMHVKDSRAFRFSDSVMLAIQNCQAFALEVHPDTLIKKMYATINDKDSTRNVRKWLSEAEYAKLAKRFKEKNGYPMGNIDPLRIESMMKPEKIKPDDKKSFVDAYLYGVARTMNKNIYGLENTAEQFDQYFGDKSDIKTRVHDLIDDNDEEELADQEKMIKVYSTGNLETIQAYLSDDGLKDDEIIARNKVMFTSMITQMANQSLFTAVGVAHLPGDDGLIALLKNAGYTVNPVNANFTGVASKFNTDYNKLSWKTYNDEENGYSISLPFMPMQTKALYGISSVIYPDMANDIFFGTYAIKKGTTTRPVTEEEVISKAIENVSINQNNHIISKATVTVNGIKGTDVLVRTGDEFTRFRLLVTNNYLYCLYAGNTLQSINSAYANRFFDSFKGLKLAEKANPTWITFKNDTGAFSVSLPGQPKLIKKDIPNPKAPTSDPYIITLYMAVDTNNLENYLVRYNDYPKGMYLADKDAMLESLANEFKNKGKVLSTPIKILKDGYEGREVDVMINDIRCRVQLFVRGNRTYLLMDSNIPAEKSRQSKNIFFDSFKFMPYMNADFTDLKFTGGNFSAKIFRDTKTTVDTTSYKSYFKSSVTTISTNPCSGGVYMVEHAAINDYYRAKNVDSLYNHVIKKAVGYQDSLIRIDTINVNGIQGREFISKKKHSDDKKRNRLFIDNGEVIILNGHMSNEELFGETGNIFFNSLKKKRATPAINLSSSKAERIVNDLSSKDTSTYNFAVGALSYYNFEKDELPYVYKALQRTYPDDSVYYGAHQRLIRILTEVHDEKSIAELKLLYSQKGINAVLKAQILDAIPTIDKKMGYDIYLDLLLNSSLIKTDNMYRVFNPLRDSVEYAAVNFGRILPLIKIPEYRESVISLAQLIANYEHSDKYYNLVKNNFSALTAYAKEDLDEYLTEPEKTTSSRYLSIYYYMQLMQKIKGQPLTTAFTSKLMKRNSLEHQLSLAVITRLTNHLPVEQKVLNMLLDSIGYRYEILEALSTEHQLARVPLKYLKQSEFAKLCLHKYITDDEDESSPESVTLLGVQTDNGKLFYVFKYKSGYEDADSDIRYIAINGPYTPGSNKFDFNNYHIYTEVAENKLTWQNQSKKMIPLLKKQDQQASKYNQH